MGRTLRSLLNNGFPSTNGILPQVHTWLILPVVICLSQRLSHACLSISSLYYETADGSLKQSQSIRWFHYSDNRSNSRANTCTNLTPCVGVFIRSKQPICLRAFRWIIVTSRIGASRQIVRISALSAFDGRIGAYHGVNGWRRIRVRFRRGSLRNGYHIQGRQQARKLPNPDTGR